jgi:prolyl-tRNA editing enzyme YbaK/EbsC (Cys-tRNA(Pro) deacylase)
MSSDTLTVLERIRLWLAAEGVPFREMQHGPTRTSEESAAARGEPLHYGGKALLLKGDVAFALCVLPADRQLDSGAVRQQFGWKKLRFATPEELREQTGLVPGSVPPFGPPILPFELCVDEQIPRQERIAFNAGSLTDSMVLAVADYLRVARPARVFRLAKPQT